MSTSTLCLITFSLLTIQAGGASTAAASEITRPDRVALFSADDPAYVRLEISPSVRTAPEESTRLVVFRGGSVILDRGLLTDGEVSPTSERGGNILSRLDRPTELAEVASDGRSAVVIASRYHRREAAGSSLVEANPHLEWSTTVELDLIDPDHPDGRWSIALEEGRWVKSAIPLARVAGVALSTCTTMDGPADFRLYGREGSLLFQMADRGTSTIGLRSTGNGAFLAADVVYSAQGGAAERGILVLDLLQGTRWTYDWSYGKESEPLSWELLETGVLEVRTSGATLRFDRNGKLLPKASGAISRVGS